MGKIYGFTGSFAIAGSIVIKIVTTSRNENIPLQLHFLISYVMMLGSKISLTPIIIKDYFRLRFSHISTIVLYRFLPHGRPFALGGVQDLLADAKTLGRDLQKFVGVDELQALLQA